MTTPTQEQINKLRLAFEEFASENILKAAYILGAEAKAAEVREMIEKMKVTYEKGERKGDKHIKAKAVVWSRNKTLDEILSALNPVEGTE